MHADVINHSDLSTAYMKHKNNTSLIPGIVISADIDGHRERERVWAHLDR